MTTRKQTSIKVDPVAVRLEGGMPFDIKVPSEKLKQAMKEAKENEGAYHESMDDLISDLKK